MVPDDLITFVSIYLLSMVKFIFGPTLGLAAGYPYLKTVLITMLGMMSSVVLFSYLGDFIRLRIFNRIYKPKKKKTFSKKSRRFVRIWRKYGVKGVAFLSPILLTPIGGTVILTTFGSPRPQIIYYMFISAIFWSFIITGFLYFGKEMVVTYV